MKNPSVKRRKNPESEPNIRRIERKDKKGSGNSGYQVHFNRSGITYTRFISDSAYGGKEAALHEARLIRGEVEQTMPPSKNGAGRKGPSKSNTGNMGVSLTVGTLRSGKKFLYVEATVRVEKGVAKNKKFRVNGYNLQDSINEAVEWRENVLAQRRLLESEERT